MEIGMFKFMVLTGSVQKGVKNGSKKGHFWGKKGDSGPNLDTSFSELKKTEKNQEIGIKWTPKKGPKIGQKVVKKGVKSQIDPKIDQKSSIFGSDLERVPHVFSKMTGFFRFRKKCQKWPKKGCFFHFLTTSLERKRHENDKK